MLNPLVVSRAIHDLYYGIPLIVCCEEIPNNSEEYINDTSNRSDKKKYYEIIAIDSSSTSLLGLTEGLKLANFNFELEKKERDDLLLEGDVDNIYSDFFIVAPRITLEYMNKILNRKTGLKNDFLRKNAVKKSGGCLFNNDLNIFPLSSKEQLEEFTHQLKQELTITFSTITSSKNKSHTAIERLLQILDKKELNAGKINFNKKNKDFCNKNIIKKLDPQHFPIGLLSLLQELAELAEIVPIYAIKSYNSNKTKKSITIGVEKTIINIENVINQQHKSINQFLDELPCEFIASSSIKLHTASTNSSDNKLKVVNAEFMIFRHFNREHYAVVINNEKFEEYNQELQNKNEEKLNNIQKKSLQQKQTPNHHDDYTQPKLIRIHSSCFTGDIFRSMRCDCYSQLHSALDYIASSPSGGAVIYLNQEGRNIGLTNKIRAYHLQQNCQIDTLDANLALGLPGDNRKFLIAAKILHHLEWEKITLLTNNPEKSTELKKYGINVQNIIPHITNDSDELKNYYLAKARRMNQESLNKILPHLQKMF